MWLTELGTEDESGYRVLIEVGILWLNELSGYFIGHSDSQSGIGWVSDRFGSNEKLL